MINMNTDIFVDWPDENEVTEQIRIIRLKRISNKVLIKELEFENKKLRLEAERLALEFTVQSAAVVGGSTAEYLKTINAQVSRQDEAPK